MSCGRAFETVDECKGNCAVGLSSSESSVHSKGSVSINPLFVYLGFEKVES